jgi:hypothetical protein
MKHIVVDGDCINSIAAQYGFADGEAILADPNNAELKKTRADGHQLHPGDEVFIPERKPKVLSLATGARHKIVVKRPTRLLRLVFRDGEGQPMSGAYTLTAGAITRQGTLDGQGALQQQLPTSATQATLTIDGVEHEVLIGHLNPLDGAPDGGLTGAQARLSNLGFAPGQVDGDLGPKTRNAIVAFQEAHGLEATGELDGATSSKLKAEHGC